MTISLNSWPTKSFGIDLGLENLAQVELRVYVALTDPQTWELTTDYSFTVLWERLKRNLVFEFSSFQYF
jgi:hypothetical protein